jgi:hypothetical protein
MGKLRKGICWLLGSVSPCVHVRSCCGVRAKTPPSLFFLKSSKYLLIINCTKRMRINNCKLLHHLCPLALQLQQCNTGTKTQKNTVRPQIIPYSHSFRCSLYYLLFACCVDLIISPNSSFKLAPPTKKPSTSFCCINSTAFLLCTLPP